MRIRFYLFSAISLILAAGLTWLWFPAVGLLAFVIGVVMLGIYDT